MERVYERCCGIDVHKKLIVACFRNGTFNEIREFGSTTKQLLKIADWLTQSKCEMIASGMDCRSAAAWVIKGELYTGLQPERIKGTGLLQKKSGPRKEPGIGPAAKNAGRSKYKIVWNDFKYQWEKRKKDP